MVLSTEMKAFIASHEKEDTAKLLLQAARYAGIDIPVAVDQIIARRQIREKLPAWYANRELVFPSRLSTEQCSSEITARYKQSLIKGKHVCDLTGGLGIDTWYFSQKADTVVYVEQLTAYSATAKANFKTLGAINIHVLNADSRDIAETLETDTFYLDPARRADGNKRVFALEDCEPDILQLKPLLLDRAQRIVLKISPMADITETLRLLPETIEVHTIAVKNECKEVLFVLEKERCAMPLLYAINYTTEGKIQRFSFTLQEEKEAELKTTDKVATYLYEPHAALLKSGAFKLTGTRYGVLKLNKHSHLYTSDELITDFPGRAFRVTAVHGFSGKQLKQLGKSVPQANITVRNFPLKVEEIRKISGIRDGGEVYLFATTLAGEEKVIIECKK